MRPLYLGLLNQASQALISLKKYESLCEATQSAMSVEGHSQAVTRDARLLLPYL